MIGGLPPGAYTGTRVDDACIAMRHEDRRYLVCDDVSRVWRDYLTAAIWSPRYRLKSRPVGATGAMTSQYSGQDPLTWAQVASAWDLATRLNAEYSKHLVYSVELCSS